MAASPFDGSLRVVVILAESMDAPAVREQRAELLKHVAAMDERDMVAFVALPDGKVKAIHGPVPSPAEVLEVRRRTPSLPNGFAVLLVGKDGGVKLSSERPVRTEDLSALIDTMPMRRREMKR